MTSQNSMYGSNDTIANIGAIENPKTTLERCAANVNDFIDYIEELYDDCSERGFHIVPRTLFDIGINVIMSYTPLDFLEAMIENSNEYWDEIYRKDEKFFDENIDRVFTGTGIDSSNVGVFKSLMKAEDENGNLVIDKEKRDVIWKYMHSFVRLCINHIHERRGPKVQITVNERGQIMTNSEGKEMKVPIYIAKYMEDIDLMKYFSLYGKGVKNCKRVFSDKFFVDSQGEPVELVRK